MVCSQFSEEETRAGQVQPVAWVCGWDMADSPGSAGTWAHRDEEAAPQGSLLLSASYAPQDTYVLLTGSENSGHDIQAVSSLLCAQWVGEEL